VFLVSVSHAFFEASYALRNMTCFSFSLPIKIGNRLDKFTNRTGFHWFSFGLKLFILRQRILVVSTIPIP
jgi:hypothetical protein